MKAVIIPHIGEAFSHLVRGMAIADQLVELGWNIEIICSTKGRTFLNEREYNKQYSLVPWHWGHNQYPLSPVKDGYFNDHLETLKSILRIVEKSKPDLIIGIPGIASFQLAKKMCTPHISVLHGPWLSPIAEQNSFEPYVSNMTSLSNKIIFGSIASQLHLFGRMLGLESINYHEFLKEETIAIAHPGIRFQSSRNLNQMGFIFASYGEDLSASDLDGEAEETCCVTFGTAVDADITNIVECASEMFKQVLVISGASSHNICRRNIIVKQAVSSRSLIGKIGTAISHGGIGTIGTFLACGARQLLIPTDIDQAFNTMYAVDSQIAESCGLEFWSSRRILGRIMPPINKESILNRLELLATSSPRNSTGLCNGALDVALYANNLYRR